MKTCCEIVDNVFYYPAINEDGWKCSVCGEKLGFRPDLDRKLLYGKVRGLLTDLHERRFIYVSNGSQGDCITANVCNKCERTNRFDQLSIISFILADGNIDAEGHAEYWQKASQDALKSKSSSPREAGEKAEL